MHARREGASTASDHWLRIRHCHHPQVSVADSHQGYFETEFHLFEKHWRVESWVGTMPWLDYPDEAASWAGF